MPVTFKVYKEDGFYEAHFSGVITDEEMIEDYRRFFDSPEWAPGMDELACIIDADIGQVTLVGMEGLMMLIKRYVQKYNFHPKSAIYTTDDLAYGLSRIFSAESALFLDNRVFRDLTLARQWISKPMVDDDGGGI